MKQWIRRGAALGLALALTVTAASASQAMGWDVHTGRAPLSQGASLGKNVFWSDTYSDLRTEYYVEYSPNASVVPTVAYGSKVTDRVTLSGMAQTLESQGKRVVSGLNGDWYVLSTGAPTGLVVTDGIVRATGYYNDTWAIGFNADGTAFIARNGLSVSVSFGGQAVKLGGGINKVRKLTDSAAVGGLTLLTDDFATTTQNTEPGVDVILSPVDDGTGTYAVKPTIGRQTQYVVEQVLESTGSIPIPEGKAVLTLNAKESEEALARLRALQPGDTVTLTVSSSDQRWSQAVQALGGVSKLVTNGQVDSGLDASRTAWPAIGIKADGTVIFYAMDGKQPGYSVGATQGQVAQRLIELGCVEAICMDGGGSTTIGVTTRPGGHAGGQQALRRQPAEEQHRHLPHHRAPAHRRAGLLLRDPFRQHPALRGHGAALRYRAGHQLLPHQRRRRELVGVQRRRHCGRERPLYRRGGERLCPGHRHRRLRLRHRLHHHRPHPGRDHPDQ
ncbi:MAG: phosphodiester glycosidase family protein [Flavonifractor plautii]